MSRREAKEASEAVREEGLSSELGKPPPPLPGQVAAGSWRPKTAGISTGAQRLEEKKTDYPNGVDCVETCTESCFIVVGGGGKTLAVNSSEKCNNC